jgi:L-asparaginase / beta-aspartyl-peptidase
VVAVHGGAGTPRGGVIEDEAPYHAALAAAVARGFAALSAGAGALGAAQAAVEQLEDCPLFNAGRGSVLAADATVEMDAALMCGRTRRAGAVAVVRTVRHPVALARAVMERTPHVLLAGPAADRLGGEWGLETVDPRWLVTDRQRARWRATVARAPASGPRGAPAGPASTGTVGAVVVDADGHLAAATSTGGVRGQRNGRIGDSPLIGAGTYAEDGVCAVSATGHGESLVRAVAAHEVAALVHHAGHPLAYAAEAVVARAGALGGGAGLIAVAPDGALAMPFTTAVMHRGWRAGAGPVHTEVRAGGAPLPCGAGPASPPPDAPGSS